MGKKHTKKNERRTLENPAIPISAAAIVQYLGFGAKTLAGVEVSPGNAERMVAVWRAVNLTAGTVAGLPLKVYRDRGGIREELDDVQLFVDPMYPEITWYEGIETAVRHLLLWGNAYFLKIYNEGGTAVVRLLPIPPDSVRVYRNENGIKVFDVEGIDEDLTAAEVLHIPWVSHDGVCGISPIEVARQAIGAGIAAEEVAAKMWDSGLLMGGVLKATADLSDEQAEAAKRRWVEKVQGQVRAYEVALLSNGFDFTPASIPPEQAQWIESRHFSVEEIGRVFGVPPALLFEYTATGNIEADKLGAQWLRFGLNNVLTRIEKRLSLHLLPRGTFCEFVREGLLQGTPAEQIDLIVAQVEAKLLTVNEARALMNRKPLPEDEINPPAPPAPPEDDSGAGNEDVPNPEDDSQQEPGE